MPSMKKSWTKYLFVITLLFFALGFVNIIFAWLGLVCLIMPFVLLAKDRKKTWCQKYCPRSSLFTVLFQGRSLTGRTGPDWLVKGKGRWIVLIYFCFNLFVITMSTFRVSRGLMAPFRHIRFLIAVVLPWKMPQALNFGPIPDWALHLSFRIYSMMFTTVVLGIVLGWLFYPRTWCRVCPVNTLSDVVLSKGNSRQDTDVDTASYNKT